MFLVVIGIGASIFNTFLDLDSSVYISVAMVTNTGTGSGAFFSTYDDFPIWAKFVSCALMFLGRMEILAILVIFTPGFWLEFAGRSALNKTKERLMMIGAVKDIRKRRQSREEEGFDDELPDDETEEPVDIPDDPEDSPARTD